MLRFRTSAFAFVLVSALATVAGAQQAAAPSTRTLGNVDLTDGYLSSADGVKIHYVAAGKGPLMVLVHGFADFWYTWRYQLPRWSADHRVVAIDLRGYNLSDKPEGVEHYTIETLVADLDATLRHFRASKATVVGHDWGGFLAWEFAMRHPDRVERLVVLNSPHPQAVLRELSKSTDPAQLEKRRQSLTGEEALLRWTPQRLASWVRDPLARQRYIEAFRRSSVEAILNHYKAHYSDPRRETRYQDNQAVVHCPVLEIHGLLDSRVPPAALHDNWQWIDRELTIVLFRKAGHLVHHDMPEEVADRVSRWLQSSAPASASVARGASSSPTRLLPPQATPPAKTSRRPPLFSPRRR